MDISEIFTKEGIKKLTKGQILRFNDDGKLTELKISKVDKKNGKVYANPVTTFRSDELVITDKKANIFGRRKRRSILEEAEDLYKKTGEIT